MRLRNYMVASTISRWMVSALIGPYQCARRVSGSRLFILQMGYIAGIGS
jgi:hypothetical protein